MVSPAGSISLSDNGSGFEFPCDIPVKIFGRNEDAFREAVIGIVRSYFPDLADAALTERPSRREKYLSITVTVWVEERSQIDALYTGLTAHEAVLMVL